MRSQTLFSDTDLSQHFRSVELEIEKRINNMSDDQFRGLDLNHYIAQTLDQITFDPLILHEEKIEYEDMGQVDIPRKDFGQIIHVKGLSLAAHLPYEGTKFLFECVPSSRLMVRLEAVVTDNEIVVIKSFTPNEQDRIKGVFEREIDNIKFYINSINGMVEKHTRSAHFSNASRFSLI
jgi:hypothetical protein